MKMVFASVAALGVLAAAPAMAQTPARYVQGNIGAVVDNSFDLDGATGGHNSRYSDDADGGIYASLAVGQALTPKWTLEGEVVYAEMDVETTYIDIPAPTSGSITPFSQMPEGYTVTTYGVLLNANYEVYRSGKTAAYAGAGIGFGHVEYQEKSWYKADIADDNGVMWQIKAGVTHDLNEKMAVDVSYRYLTAPEASGYGDAPALQALSVGLRYRF